MKTTAGQNGTIEVVYLGRNLPKFPKELLRTLLLHVATTPESAREPAGALSAI
jgi:hypothetical protein